MSTITRPDRGATALHLLVGALLGAVLMLVSLIAGAETASATRPVVGHQPPSQPWVQPYGGCKEAWQAPRSRGANDCRAHGWVIRPRLVVGPHQWVHYSRLPSCRYEDASSGPVPCSWNFGTTDGNGRGDAYYVIQPKGHGLWFFPVRGVVGSGRR